MVEFEAEAGATGQGHMAVFHTDGVLQELAGDPFVGLRAHRREPKANFTCILITTEDSGTEHQQRRQMQWRSDLF